MIKQNNKRTMFEPKDRPLNQEICLIDYNDTLKNFLLLRKGVTYKSLTT